MLPDAPAPWSPLPSTGGGAAVVDADEGHGGEGPRIPTRAAWWALVGIIVGELLGGFLGSLVSSATHRPVTSAFPDLAGEIGLWAGMLGAVVLVSRRYGTGSLARDFGLGIRPRDLLLALGAAVAGVVVVDLISAAFVHTRLSGTNTQILSGQRGSGVGFTVVTLVAAIGAPLFEELFFRGLLRTALATRLGATGAIWAQAALFGLAHFEPSTGWGNVSVCLAIGAFGVILGYTARITGRLGGGMVAHSLFNLVAAITILAT